MSNEQYVTSPERFRFSIAHCSLLISGDRFRGSIREKCFRRIIFPRHWNGALLVDDDTARAPAPASADRCGWLLLVLLRFLNLLEVFGRFLLEILQAVFAAEFDLLPLVREDVSLIVLAELLVGDDALVQGIGFGFIGCADAQGSGSQAGEQRRREYLFH